MEAMVAVLAISPFTWGKEPYRQVLVSASLNMNVDPNNLARAVIASRYAVPDCPIPWSVRKFRHFGGKQEQIDVIWIDNGKLKIGVIPTRGMGILSVIMDGTRVLGWDSPVKDIVHPSLVNLNSRGGLGWLDGFNEWLCRCGMEWNGQPGTDRFLNNMGEESTMELTLHGRIANLPAQEVVLIAQRDPPYRLTLRGIVHERMFNGPKLELTTELSIEPGARAFRLSDAVTNRGGTAARVPDALSCQLRATFAGGWSEASGSGRNRNTVQRPRGQGDQAVQPVPRPQGWLH